MPEDADDGDVPRSTDAPGAPAGGKGGLRKMTIGEALDRIRQATVRA